MSSLFFLYNRKFKKTFCFNDNNGKLWVEVIIVTFFGCSSDCICPHSKHKRRKSCQTSNCKFCITKIVALFWENKQTPTRLLVLLSFLICLPPEIPRDITFVPAILVVSKVYSSNWLTVIQNHFYPFSMFSLTNVRMSRVSAWPEITSSYAFLSPFKRKKHIWTDC